MVNLFFLKRQKEKELFLVLDIGTEAVKVLIFEKRQGKISVLGGGLEYFDRFRALESGKFETEVIKKTISKAVEEAQKESGVKTNSIFLGFSCDILKGRTISYSLKRKENKFLFLKNQVSVPKFFKFRNRESEIKNKRVDEKEEGEIKETVLREAKKKIAESYALQKGILPQDIQFQELRILETKIDGYRVPSLLGYDGEKADFKILATFLPKYYLESNFSDFISPPIIPIIREMGFKILEIRHPIVGLLSFLSQYPDALLLDIGGEVTQIFLAKRGILEEISEFETGGRQFSQILSENLGLSELEARNLKHRYSKRDLTEESRREIGKLLKISTHLWFQGLKEKLREIGSGIFPSEFFIFGGGALLPEIEEILEQGDWEDISFAEPPKVKFLQSKDLINIEEKIGLTAQNTPSLLNYHSIKGSF
ncbi:MAG: hypothetical protein COT33_00235 [Candidatus Nealsonbacteria bacterium CG08_land_8_20_14_0_20_38_20]|uniref:SHS2 domain-containing protein n=1 Tax=Candidatus Nealsonbacteria bacterium CG08_land_8_20_14_0_20_38_20 TaxID=1974705 RepID=A0A2H0YMX4_9BACT|nr:MAG: hypothetical protein COT33_00235 [Candidatus Nealsonbacteria bacterium CG08_land_8_20_14_0_20_38_20]